MSDLIIPPGCPPDLRAASTADLRAELSRALEVTATHLTHLATVWRELEHRGEDLSGLRGGLWAYMPLIASGRLRAEIVVQYAGHAMLLRRLADIPPEEQDTLLRDNTVPVVSYVDGEFREERKPLTHLRAQEISQVLSGRVRPPEEQRRAAVGRATRKTTPATGAARVVEMARTAPDKSAGAWSVSLPLTPAEREYLQGVATRQGVPIGRLVRSALVAAGLLADPS